jgi:hypothetical protein
MLLIEMSCRLTIAILTVFLNISVRSSGLWAIIPLGAV